MAVQETRFRAFVTVWAGQFLSLLGSALTDFALGVYVYRLTGSATTLAAVLVLGLLPMILASPFAGPLVDRWGPKPALVACSIGNIVLAAVLAVLLFTDAFEVWHVYPIVALGSTIGALELPALSALTPRLVAKQDLGRANGLRMVAVAASQVLAPVSAGILLLTIDIGGIVVLDLVTFAVALGLLLAVDVPRERPADEDADEEQPSSLLSEFRDGWRYVATRRGLLSLLLFLAAVNFSAGVINLLLTPLVLDFSSSAGLGTVMSAGGAGMVVASIAVSAWGGPARRVRGILASTLVLAAATVIGASRPSVLLVAAAAFVFLGALGVIVSTNQVIWQSKVPSSMLGRVGALVNMVFAIPQLVAYLVAGPAVDLVFEPLVGPPEGRSELMNLLVGDGENRGAALLMMLVGVLIAVTVGVAALDRRLRALEEEIPDADEPAPDEAAAPDVAIGARAHQDPAVAAAPTTDERL